MPVQCKGAIFDLDGVITATASIHAQAWEAMFNDFLKKFSERENMPFRPFDPKDDYNQYVDGKPRFEGVMSFLKSRHIQLPYGTPDDTPEMETIHGLGNKKNIAFQEILLKEGPEVFDSSVSLIKDLKKRGIKVGVASSSRNCKLILELAGLLDLFEVRVDGVVSEKLNLKGKPEPDIFVSAADKMGLFPNDCIVVEDAISGVQAGNAGNFGYVIGIARNIDGELLRRFGADIVIRDLSEITYADIERWFTTEIQEDKWRLRYHGHDPGDEKLRETLTTVGNGYLGTRGCYEGEDASFNYYPGTYIAGIYNRVPTTLEGRTIYNNDFVNCPNWLPIEFRIGNAEYISPLSMEILSYAHFLDIRRGVMARVIICKDSLGRITRVESERLVSMADRHLCGIRFKLTPMNYTSEITIRSSIDGNVSNDGVPRYRQLTSKHLSYVDGREEDDSIYLHMRTTESKYDIIMNAKSSVYEGNKKLAVHKHFRRKDARVMHEMTISAKENTSYRFEKLVSIFTSRDQGIKNPDTAARATLDKATTYQALLTPHIKAWQKLWEKADFEIEGDRFIQKVARLHIYHLLITASPHNKNIDAGMPARGLHGEAYRGHIFWDELYILSFFDLNFPDITKSLLKYRYNCLDAAKEYARQNGYEGAMYPWQTADTGEEETQEIHYNPESRKWGPDLSRRQRHVSIAVFYNVWRYLQSTGDMKFIRDYGAEIMLEIARFWASIAEYDSATGRYHISGIMGPDEFHEKLPDASEPGLKDNAYTNVMVVWLLEKTMEFIDLLPASAIKKLKEKTNFNSDEMKKWEEITRKININIREDGIIEQFQGYFGLKDLDWEDYRKRYYSIQRMDRILKAEGDSPDRYKVAKQADTLMMFYVLTPEEVRRILNRLGYDIDDGYELLRKNYEYYEPRTSHGSTLSKVVHAFISSYIHEDDRPWNWFMEAMRSDIYDTQGGTTQEGIHTGVMAGTLDIIVRSFARLDLLREPLEINPRLPEHWRSLKLKINHKRVWYDFDINKKSVSVTVSGEGEGPAYINVLHKDIELTYGEQKKIKLNRKKG